MDQRAGTPRGVLVFTRTCDYRHESIPAGVRAVRDLAADDGLTVHHTEDPCVFRPDALADQRVVVWLSPSGEVLGPDERGAFSDWLRAGGAFAGIHSASTCEDGWPEYEEIVGARFARHPEVQTATVRVEDHAHPSTAGLASLWTHRDEWYDFRSNPRGAVRVLATVDEETYEGGGMGADHPVVWCGSHGRGRTWYTALGHGAELYSDPAFLAHLRGGLRSLWSPTG